MDSVERLLQIMARLRDRERGCPWDVEQTFASIAPHTIEEAYEVDDAIRRGDMDALREELGDLLLQVVFHAQMAREDGLFDFAGVAETLADKLVRRHPHVFGDAEISGAEEQLRAWEDLKARERAQKRGDDAPPSALDDVALGLPALLRAQKLVRRAARASIDVPAPVADDAWAAFRAAPSDASLGELLLAIAATASRAGLDAERALRDETERFERRARDAESAKPEGQGRSSR